MLKLILLLVIELLAVLMGAWFVGDAVESFRQRRYYKFGFNLMFAIWEATLMIKYLVL